MKEFFTRELANEGIEIPLVRPDGSETKHSIRIRGVDSDAFKAANAASRRRVFALATSDNRADLDSAEITEKLEVLSSLVMSWTFEEPCTPENVKAFLKEAPQIAEQIDRVSTRRSLFFGKSLKPSSASPVPTSSSTPPPTEAVQVSATT